MGALAAKRVGLTLNPIPGWLRTCGTSASCLMTLRPLSAGGFSH